jgi:UDP-N-acetylmuramoyl-L-alanyl-D-glutamate--2,6-diaminopimelate ligase
MSSPSLSLDRVVEVLRSAGLEVELRGQGDLAASGVAQNSREISSGDLFLAWKGTAHDAHDFVADAARAGAVAAVVERFLDVDLPQIRVEDGRRAAAIAAHLLVGSPGERLLVAGVTGTNGKTTTVLLARHLLARRGPAAAMGTLGVTGPDGQVREGTENLTTPGPVELARRLADLVSEGVTSVSLEASSHALEQRRLDGISFHLAAFTNLTRDHLDYHGSFPEYLKAKARLLDLLRDDGGVVVNGNDPAWAGLPAVPGRLLVARIEGAEGVRIPSRGERLPDLVARELELNGAGSHFRLSWGDDEVEVTLPLLGRFNVENALAALGLALLAGVSLEEAAGALSAAPAPRGRLEVVAREPATVLVDFAHTPDALVRVLETLRPLYPGRLIVVFGAGGDRDRAKRPEMGRAVAEAADLAVVTSDNPRTEDPERILDDVTAGMEGATWERVVDRRKAIARALELAGEGDAVLLAGKGHETYQVVGTEKRPFDERKIVREILDAGRAA